VSAGLRLGRLIRASVASISGLGDLPHYYLLRDPAAQISLAILSFFPTRRLFIYSLCVSRNRDNQDSSTQSSTIVFKMCPPEWKSCQPFEVAILETALRELSTLLRLSRLPPEMYERLQRDRRYGITLPWMSNAKDAWEIQLDW
jgi:hypothetical protein